MVGSATTMVQEWINSRVSPLLWSHCSRVIRWTNDNDDDDVLTGGEDKSCVNSVMYCAMHGIS